MSVPHSILHSCRQKLLIWVSANLARSFTHAGRRCSFEAVQVLHDPSLMQADAAHWGAGGSPVDDGEWCQNDGNDVIAVGIFYLQCSRTMRAKFFVIQEKKWRHNGGRGSWTLMTIDDRGGRGGGQGGQKGQFWDDIICERSLSIAKPSEIWDWNSLKIKITRYQGNPRVLMDS